MTSEHIQPNYAGVFHCIGAACEDTCCRRWTVQIDKATYEKYESIPELAARLKELVPVTAEPTDADFARIKNTPSGHCPFLVDGWCEIHKKYGAEYLSDTCATYPRKSRRIDGHEETAIRLSCPEAARVVLLNPVLLPSEDGMSTHARYGAFLFKKGAVASEDNPVRHFWELRKFTIALIRDPRYAVWQRLFILGCFCGRLQELVATGKPGIPKLLNDYAEIVMEKKLRPVMDGIPIQAAHQLDVVDSVARGSAESRSCAAFLECLDEFRQGIQAQSPEGIIPAYTEAAKRYYRPFMEKHLFIWENYLVNHVFDSRFPFCKDLGAPGETGNPQTAYFMMCIHFAVIQTMLIGMAGYHREKFDLNHVVKLVYSFTRVADHNPALLKEIESYLTKVNLVNATGMAILLKNPAD